MKMKPEDTIDFNIRSTWHKIARMYNVQAAEHGVSMATGMVLLNIDLKEGTPSTSLGPKMGMESRSLTRTLKNLEETIRMEGFQPPTLIIVGEVVQLADKLAQPAQAGWNSALIGPAAATATRRPA